MTTMYSTYEWVLGRYHESLLVACLPQIHRRNLGGKEKEEATVGEIVHGEKTERENGETKKGESEGAPVSAVPAARSQEISHDAIIPVFERPKEED